MIFGLFWAFQTLQNSCKIASDFQCRFGSNFGWILGAFGAPFWGSWANFGGQKFQFSLDVIFKSIFIGFGAPLGCILGGLDELVGTKNCIFSGWQPGAGFSFNF